MNPTIRRIAVSGSAAIALLGGAATISMASAPDASATEVQATIDRAAGTPVNLPDGRVMHIRGLDSVSYQAAPAHHTAVVTLAADTNPGGTYNDQTGTGTGLQNPNIGNGVSYTPAQVQTQVSGGGAVIGAGVAAIVILGIIVFFRVKHHHLKIGDAVVVAFLGVALTGTVFGTLANQLTNTGVTSISGIVGGL